MTRRQIPARDEEPQRFEVIRVDALPYAHQPYQCRHADRYVHSDDGNASVGPRASAKPGGAAEPARASRDERPPVGPTHAAYR